MRTIHKPRTRGDQRYRRHLRVRKKVTGSPDRPRLVVFRSSRFTYAQIVDDTRGETKVAYNSRMPGFALPEGKRGKVGAAYAVGKRLGELAKEAGITKVVFDRGGYLFHGRVRAVAEGAREAGLEF